MDENPPALPSTPPLFDAKLWKLVLAPLAPLVLAAIVSKPAPSAAGVLLTIAGFAMLICSIWTAVILGKKVGKTPGARFGWGLLAFCVLQLFYIGVSVVGCVVVLAAQ